MLAGCLAPRDPNLLSKEEWVRQEYASDFDPWSSLYGYTNHSNRPVKGVVVEHDGFLLKVKQVIPLSSEDKSTTYRVLVEDSNFERRTLQERLALAILTKQEYVDGEYISAGFYSFMGPCTYTNTGNSTSTVRQFADLSLGPVAAKDRRRRGAAPTGQETK